MGHLPRITLRVEIDDRAGREIVCAEQSPTCSFPATPDCATVDAERPLAETTTTASGDFVLYVPDPGRE